MSGARSHANATGTHAQTYAIRRAGAMNEIFPITVRQTQRIASQWLFGLGRITGGSVIPAR